MCAVRWSPSYWMRLNSTRPPKAHGEEFTQPLLPRENKKMPRWFSSDLVSLSNIIRRNWFRDDETFPLIGCWRCNVLWKMVAWLEASVFVLFFNSGAAQGIQHGAVYDDLCVGGAEWVLAAAPLQAGIAVLYVSQLSVRVKTRVRKRLHCQVSILCLLLLFCTFLHSLHQTTAVEKIQI